MGALTATILSMACAPSTPGPEFNHPIPPQSHGFDGFLPDVEKVVLENGMRVLVLPRQGIPTVSFVMQYGIGGIHERPGETGVAHLLEHMLFKGSETIGTTDVAAERVLFRAQRLLRLLHVLLEAVLLRLPRQSHLLRLQLLHLA